MGRSEYVYGLHAVRALLTRHATRVRRVLLARGREDARAAALEQLVRAARIGVERLPREALERLVGEVVHQGVVAEVEPLPLWREEQLLEAVTAVRDPLILALDGVQDPHNLGACLRTADACGVLAVVIPRDRSAPLNATARKVAAGAAETTPVAAVTNLARTLRLLKQAGLWIVGADAAGEKAAAQIELTGPLVLVMGAEGAGLRELTRRHCDWLARLPDLGAVESLNVSVASGMMLYEALRQRLPPAMPRPAPGTLPTP
ncbi:MAG: 23S rRNA (guanosine(2251)-2'-O)-methyltransferase RlmB [Gammaproteobacteria bacterium]|nr:23S rRNA (guanosine(2251)-2'-O)-methyltransferase RlmB [Gammaproteobacteria bacterium]